MPLSRREFCTRTGVLLLGFALPTVPRAVSAQAARPSPSLAANPRLNAWLRIGKDGSVGVYSGKCEFGQGIGTALAQIVADELDVAFERVRIHGVDTESSPDEAYTFGSLSIQHSGGALRAAAAEARQLLLRNASRQLDIAADRITVEDGLLLVDGLPSGLRYDDLLARADFDVEVSGDTATKSARQYALVGQSLPRLDLPGKIFADPVYIQDVRLPGMLHARVVRPPSQHQALESFDAVAARSMPGVIAIVNDASFLAVVAKREEQAINAAAVLQDNVTWSGVSQDPPDGESPSALRQMPSRDSVIRHTNDEAADVVDELTADYSRPFIAHASMSPAAAIAMWDEERLTVWSHGQGMYPLRGAIARVVGLPAKRVRLIHREASGCYGHNGADDAACDAALVAKAVRGVPIRLQWSRQDEFRYEPLGSAMSMRVAAGLDENGGVTHWQFDVWSGTHSSRPFGADAAGNLRAAREKRDALSLPPPRNLQPPTGGGDRNAMPLYTFPNQLVSKHLVTGLPRFVSALRSLGAHANVFAIESFVDELALVAGLSPLDFRLQNLDDERAINVLEPFRDLLSARPDPVDGFVTGRGLGFARYKNVGAYAGVVCDAGVDLDSGEIRVLRAWATIDAGLAVNPDGISNQMEGGVIQATSWTLKEAVRLGDAESQSDDWSGYPILRFSEAPEVSVTVIESDAPSLGAGEAAQGPAAAAIGNAVFAASGARLRDLPMTPERVLRAMQA